MVKLSQQNSSASFLYLLLNLSFLTFEKALKLGAFLIINITLARQFGPEKFGEISFLIAIAGLLLPFTHAGLHGLLVRELITYPGKEKEILTSAISIRLVGSTLSTMGFWLFSNFSPYFSTNEQLLILLLLAGNGFSSFHVIDYFFQSRRNFKLTALLRSIITIFFTAAKLYVAIFKPSVIGILIIYATENTILAFGYIFLTWKSKLVLTFRNFSLQRTVSLFKKCHWLILSGAAAAVNLKIDQTMLKFMASNTEVGIYSAAAQLSESWYFLPTAAMTILLPSLISTKKENPQQYQYKLQNISDQLFIFSLLIAITITISAPFLLPLLFGESYLGSIAIIQIHIWAGLFISMRALLSKWIITEELLYFSLVSQLLGAFANIAINYHLIPETGAMGAAKATVISYAISSYLCLFLNKKTLPIAKIMTLSLLSPLRIPLNHLFNKG